LQDSGGFGSVDAGRASYNGSIEASQASDVGSIPIARSRNSVDPLPRPCNSLSLLESVAIESIYSLLIASKSSAPAAIF
jgi:hypothetical protein